MLNLRYPLLLILFIFNFSGTPILSKKKEEKKVTVTPIKVKKENNEFIPWLHDRILIWEDFQCAPKRYTDAVASTSTSLGLAYQLKGGELTYEITCNFSKTKSWGSLKTDYILAHEQGHFDITEIYARKLHHALAAYKFSAKTYQTDINRIYQKTVKEKENLQNMYDGQSDHSRNKKVQANWAQIINVLLMETEPYSDYP